MKKSYILILIFLLAFIVRFIFVLQSDEIPLSDASVYDRLALSIAKGEGYVNTDGTPHSFYPPFYPFFLSIIYKIFGHSYGAVRVVQSVIGALSCMLIYLIGKRIYSNAAGLIASFVSIGYFPFIKSAELLLTELIFTFLLLLIILYLLKIQESLRFKDCVILGILLGISLLTKSVMLFFPLFIVPVFFYMRRYDYSTVFKKYMAVLCFFGLLMVSWGIRNFNIFHRFAPVTTQTGIGFYSSYRPPDGIFGRLATAEDPVIREAGRIKDPVLKSNFLIKKTLEFIINHPKEVAVLELKKILYLWVPFDWEIVGGRWFNLVYMVMLPFFAIGFVLSFKRFRKFYPILLPVFYFQLMTLIFYGSPRFRLPIEPYIFILSIIGILECARWIREQRRVKVIGN